jgi:MarR family transcriptional regulator, transcriptional regulator for hemolysin
MKGNQDALVGFTDEETTQLATLLNRLIANLDNAACPEE